MAAETRRRERGSRQPRPLLWLQLTKPRIVLMNVLVVAGSYLLAEANRAAGLELLWTLLGAAAAVGSANALNMILERRSDALMERTRRRPLPTGALPTGEALAVALALGALAWPLLHAGGGTLTAALGVGALLGYALIYTPLKRLSPLALLVGAVPGAAPALLGWVAATGRLDAPGLVLFGSLFLWQIPHFMAIVVLRRAEYERAGLRVAPAAGREQLALAQGAAAAGLLVPVSLALVPLGSAGWIYGALALPLGLGFLFTAARAVLGDRQRLWAGRVMRASLLYLPALVLALALDGWLG